MTGPKWGRNYSYLPLSFFLGLVTKPQLIFITSFFYPPPPHSPRPWPPASWSVFLPSEATQTFIFEGYEFFFSPVVFEHNKWLRAALETPLSFRPSFFLPVLCSNWYRSTESITPTKYNNPFLCLLVQQHEEPKLPDGNLTFQFNGIIVSLPLGTKLSNKCPLQEVWE